MKENVGLTRCSESTCFTHLYFTSHLVSPSQSLRLVSSEQALKELGLNEHQLRFTCRVHLQDPHSDNDTLHRIYTHLKRCYWGYWDREDTSGGYTEACVDTPCLCVFSVLKGYTIQHLPDGTVMVESIVVKVSSSAEDASMKVLLLSWSYQVRTQFPWLFSAGFLIFNLNVGSCGMM